LFHRDVGRLNALEDLIDIGGSAPIEIVAIGAVANETASLDILFE
jgi:hypothetical protein